MTAADVVNFIVVTLYGSIITLLFAKNKCGISELCGMIAVFVFGGLLNLGLSVFAKLGNDVLYMVYPLTVHLPLLLFCVFVLKVRFCRALFAADNGIHSHDAEKVASSFFSNSCFHFYSAEARLTQICLYLRQQDIISSAVILAVTVKFAVPSVRRDFRLKGERTDLLCILPAAVYVVIYATTVYSDFLYGRPEITMPILTTLLSMFFIAFTIFVFDLVSGKRELRHSEELLEMQHRAVSKLSHFIGGDERWYCKNTLINDYLSMYDAAAKSAGILFVCNCNFSEDTETDASLVIITSILDDVLGKAKKHIKLEALRKRNRIDIMVEADCGADYGASLLPTLGGAVRKNNGIIFSDENIYKIQISIKGENKK